MNLAFSKTKQKLFGIDYKSIYLIVSHHYVHILYTENVFLSSPFLVPFFHWWVLFCVEKFKQNASRHFATTEFLWIDVSRRSPEASLVSWSAFPLHTVRLLESEIIHSAKCLGPPRTATPGRPGWTERSRPGLFRPTHSLGYKVPTSSW